MSQTTAIATVQPDHSPEGLMALAIDRGVSVEGLEKLMVLAAQVREQRAKTAFIAALSSFQAECPTIEKTRQVKGKDGKTVRYCYAAMEDIKAVIAPLLGDHGLSYTFDTSIEGGQMTVFCHVRHEEGHCESSSFAVPVGSSGYMTAPQEVASALTYAKRYALINSLGLAIGDEDDDAQPVQKPVPKQEPKPEQKQEPKDTAEINALKAEWKSFLAADPTLKEINHKLPELFAKPMEIKNEVWKDVVMPTMRNAGYQFNKELKAFELPPKADDGWGQV